MQVSVVIQRLNGLGFCAKTVSPPLLSATGPTRDVALASLRDQLTEQFSGEEVVSLDVPIRGETAWDDSEKLSSDGPSNPWTECAGVFKDHPLFDEALEHMQVYREQRDREMDEVVD
jgi:hypothetical protein